MKIKYLKDAAHAAKLATWGMLQQSLQDFCKQAPTSLGKRLTPWMQFLANQAAVLHTPPADTHTFVDSRQLLDSRFSQVRPLPVFSSRSNKRRVVLVIDHVPDDVLADASRAAVVFAALFAKHLNADLRILTRQKPLLVGQFKQLLRQEGVDWQDNVDFVHAPYEQTVEPIDLAADDVFVTTSWWVTASVRRSVNPKRIVYLLQEDERLQYPAGDDLLRCEETLLDSDIRYVIKSQSLYKHFCTTGSATHASLQDRAVWFEPAMAVGLWANSPEPAVSKPKKSAKPRKYNFLFAAFPQQPAYLYYRGLEVIHQAIEQQLLTSDAWNFYFLGENLQEVVLADDIRPQLCSNLSWEAYQQLLQSMDVGLALSYTPWPSDISRALLACGAVVVSNGCSAKDTSKTNDANNLYAASTTADLLEALKTAVRLAKQPKKKATRAVHQTTQQDWPAVLSPVFAKL